MILEFLGGAAFRALAGQVVSVWTKWQDHRHEKELMKLQMEMEKGRAELQMQQQRLASELGIRTIEVQKDADVAREEAAGWAAAVAAHQKPTGIKWVDAWNGIIRPAFATLCLYLWYCSLSENLWVLDTWDKELMGLVVGFFFADRQMKRVGK